MTDLDLDKYRYSKSAIMRRMGTYSDHGVEAGETGSLAGHLATWMPYLHSVVDPTNRVHGGEVMQIGGDAWELVHTPGHSLGHICLWSPRRRAILSGERRSRPDGVYDPDGVYEWYATSDTPIDTSAWAAAS